MNASPTPAIPADRVNLNIVVAYLAIILCAFFGGLLYLLLNKPLFMALVLVGLPVAILVVCHPRLALYQFMAVLFVHMAAIPSVHLLLIDVSAFLVITAALLDIFLREETELSIPKFTMNYVAILGALLLAGLFAYDPGKMFRPLLRVALLLVTFLSVYRLMRHDNLSLLVKLFFGLATVNSLIVVAQFAMSGGSVRAFGLAPVLFDDLSMLALPVGLALYLWSDERHGWLYLVSAFVVLLALIATQSRAPILFGLFAAALTIWLSHLRGRRLSHESGSVDGKILKIAERMRKRTRRIVGLAITGIVAVVITHSSFFVAALSRFELLLNARPSGTFAVRLHMWQTAFQTFLNHPLMGIGPGQFPRLYEVNATVHLDPVYIWIREKSAHNLLLHYMAETGLVGALALMALMVNQFRWARRRWLGSLSSGSTGWVLGVYVVATLLLLTTVLEAGWLWGQTGYMAVFFLAVIARATPEVRRSKP
jgi:O-antigen ligase